MNKRNKSGIRLILIIIAVLISAGGCKKNRTVFEIQSGDRLYKGYIIAGPEQGDYGTYDYLELEIKVYKGKKLVEERNYKNSKLSGLSTEYYPGIKTVEWTDDAFLVFLTGHAGASVPQPTSVIVLTPEEFNVNNLFGTAGIRVFDNPETGTRAVSICGFGMVGDYFVDWYPCYSIQNNNLEYDKTASNYYNLEVIKNIEEAIDEKLDELKTENDNNSIFESYDLYNHLLNAAYAFTYIDDPKKYEVFYYGYQDFFNRLTLRRMSPGEFLEYLDNDYEISEQISIEYSESAETAREYFKKKNYLNSAEQYRKLYNEFILNEYDTYCFATALYVAGDYQKSFDVYMEYPEAGGEFSHYRNYNIACLLAMDMNSYDEEAGNEIIKYLKLAYSQGFNNLNHYKNDKDLDNFFRFIMNRDDLEKIIKNQ